MPIIRYGSSRIFCSAWARVVFPALDPPFRTMRVPPFIIPRCSLYRLRALPPHAMASAVECSTEKGRIALGLLAELLRAGGRLLPRRKVHIESAVGSASRQGDLLDAATMARLPDHAQCSLDQFGSPSIWPQAPSSLGYWIDIHSLEMLSDRCRCPSNTLAPDSAAIVDRARPTANGRSRPERPVRPPATKNRSR